MKYPAIVLILATTALTSAQLFANDTFLPSLTARADSDCGTQCRFRLCVRGADGENIALPTGFGLPFGMAFTAAPPFICRTRGQRVGRILRVRPAECRIRSGRFVRIARLGRLSLRNRFNPNFFNVRDFQTPELVGLSAVRRSKFRSMDQRTTLEGRCCVLPIRAWELVRRDGTVARIIKSRNRRNCVSFLSTGTTAMIKIMLMWDTAADLDLTVTEPDGFEINFNDNKSPSGGFLFEDVTLGDCEASSGARDSVEMIEYSGLSNPQTGTYTVMLLQFANCALPTNWHLSIMIGDNTVLDKHGTVDPDEDGLFKSLTFTFPDGVIVHEGLPESSDEP